MLKAQTASQVSPDLLRPGERFVRFAYTTSTGFTTVRRLTRVYHTTSRNRRILLGLWYSVVALALGPWGIPWGLIWTAAAVWTNITGGEGATGDDLYEAVRRTRLASEK